ncbi:hypothetical protein GOP47_0005215 [Adiantum capillus-veneris]|uniref:K Homology domain-containing protein n=1 Tax=Adiantum capillus-veneris TaxID=13818 RepID=A0A9D4ZNE0_ADICA|nr:hypothetical protein GOP47_0005215 [Adiantum capillus-veneris]
MIPTRQSPKPMSPMNSLSPYMQYSSSGGPSPHHRSQSAASELEKFLSELLIERQKLGPFMQVLPNCSRLLNQEIMRLTSLIGTSSFVDHDILEHGSPLSTMSSGRGVELNGWSAFQSERLVQQASAMGWRGLPGMGGVPMSSPGHIPKKLLRIDVPVDTYPNFNFVGRLLGPRGNSLKRVENNTGCRVFIRGRGSVRDVDKEESLRDKPGYEHLNEPLHILIEAELPANVIDIQLNRAREIIEDLLRPVEESHDYFKKQQLRELAMLNGTLREDTPYWNGSLSPFGSSGMKRAKTRG